MNAPVGKTRFSREDWLMLGLQSLRQSPQARLTIDALCEEAKKTKGSFYFHFTNMEAFVTALAEHWFETFTLELIRQSEKRPTPKQRLDLLNALAVQLDPQIEQGMRRLAAREASIRTICQKVDGTRLSYLTKLYSESGKYSAEDAKAIATIEYAAMVGYQQINPDAKPRETAEMYQAFLRLTGRR